jgi:hypothetical protein
VSECLILKIVELNADSAGDSAEARTTPKSNFLYIRQPRRTGLPQSCNQQILACKDSALAIGNQQFSPCLPKIQFRSRLSVTERKDLSPLPRRPLSKIHRLWTSLTTTTSSKYLLTVRRSNLFPLVRAPSITIYNRDVSRYRAKGGA